MIAEFLFEISPVVKILAVFILILVVNRFRVPLGIALVVGGFVIDLWAGKTVILTIGDFWKSLCQPELWFLIINITLILEFGYYMAYERNSQTILSAARRLGGKHGRALSLVLIPAAIGLVPMPGGALFSAPLVGETVGEKNMPVAWKTAVNYWFRHIFEYWWPLYPVVIVTLSIFSIETWKFFSVQIPFTLVSLLCGWFFLLSRQLDVLSDEVKQETIDKRRLAFVLAPIILVVLCTLFLPGLMAVIFPGNSLTMNKLLAMFTGLLISLVLIGLVSRGDREFRLFSNIVSDKTVNVVFTLGGVMVFQSMLDVSGLLPEAGRQLGVSMVPIEFVVGFLPFLAGLVTGIAIGFAGPSFPLIVGLVEVNSQLSQASALVLAFSMGYVGMMLSPVHLCYILTRRYFASGLLPTYAYILPCALSVAGWGIAMHLLLRIAGW